MAKKIRIGGSFAPPLNADKLTRYEALAADAEPQVKEGMLALAKMLRTFWETPKSAQPGTPHPSGRGIVTPLEDAEIQRIWDVVPWAEELDMYDGWFAALPQGELRNAAYHLLWYGRELVQDREPITNDQL